LPDVTRLNNRAEAVRKRLGLSEEVVEIMRDAAYNSFADCAQDMEPNFKKRRTVRRSTAIEIALDAGRPQRKITESGPLDGARWMVLLFLNSDRDYKDLVDLVGPAFTYSEYEVGS
jgi:hypothetical protein